MAPADFLHINSTDANSSRFIVRPAGREIRRSFDGLGIQSENRGGKVGRMAEATNPESFEEIVEWAHSTLPQKIRDLPDFPGIQVADEPPEDVLKTRNWPRGTEMLGCYSGVYRTKRSLNQVRTAPDLIFVFRGPILRCSKGELRSEVKRVVWHEVAHWLGHDEEQVKDLGL